MVRWTLWCDSSDASQLAQYFYEREWANLYLAKLYYKALESKSLQDKFLLGYRSLRLVGVLALDRDRRLLADVLDVISTDSVILHEILLGRWERPYCLIGHPQIIEQIENIYGKSRHFIAVDYFLMSLDQVRESYGIRDLAQNFSFKKSLIQDFQRLLPLEVGYQKEEVMVAKQHIMTDTAIALHFQRRLHDEVGYHLEYKRHVLTKLSINIMGRSYDQVAGVYTDPRFRMKGLATILLSELMKLYMNHPKGLTLFVKVDNIGAYKLYRKLGFQKKQYFRISYL
ncbi:GNAT family N-acetyltransferase [Entomospira nematocerorum]|uniref:GNAT family N-acetyltransferase n=1 Tax=Entomospira nematocerorum TaxID=2719987 RepID=A0A968KTM4_9SPIO|nr:GNAT family N-acetyltransferase [Entomospira nematocera]NIZ46339.1 GNAT family N-acetyltransferase [Entomospira nematocera]WDI33857.1 GNAT family N-acetyltransferase [Entomospira nematocera]